MNTEGVALALQSAIAQLAVALGNISEIDLSATGTQDAVSISIQVGGDINEVVVLDDGRVLFAPQKSKPAEPYVYLRGRPPGLPTQTCPTCKGKGNI
jgi:hypothetical protein